MPEQPKPNAASMLPEVIEHDPLPVRATFRPNKRQREYLDAWLDPQSPKSVHGICKATGIPRSTVYHWLRHDDFTTWFNAEIERATDHAWRPILSKLAQLALAGSVEHAKLLAQIRGAIRQDEAPGARGVTVILGMPRAGDPAPLPPADPRPALPPAPSRDEH